MHRTCRTLFLVLLWAFARLDGWAEDGWAEDRAVNAAGGGAAATGPYALTDTVGQPAVGQASSAGYTLADGFWNTLYVAPVLAVIADRTVNEGALLTFTATVLDGEAPLTFSLESAPGGMSIDAGSGAIAWTPAEAQGPGTYPITVKVTDNGTPSLSDSKTFTVKVNEVNVAPTVTLIQPTDGAVFLAASTVVLEAIADDPDGNLLKVEFFRNTNKLGEDSSAPFRFEWRNVPPGSYTLTARAIDTGGLATISAPVRIVVSSNHAPVAQDDLLERPYDHDLSVPDNKLLKNDWDPDGDSLTITYVPPASAKGAQLFLIKKKVHYYPPPGFNAPDTFPYTISDGLGGTATATVTVLVKKSDGGIKSSDLVRVKPVLAQPVHTATGFQFTLLGEPDCQYEIEVSKDLVTWTVVATQTTDVAGRSEFREPEAANRIRCFYRVRRVPTRVK